MQNALCAIRRSWRIFPPNKLRYELYPLLSGLIALAVYWLTVDPGASYWDCPEYLISALRLEVGHPPGNPGWALTHRFVSSFLSDPTAQTLVVNMMSGLFTALSVMILCSVCISLMRWILPVSAVGCQVFWGKCGTAWRSRALGISGCCASLCFTFADSVWYSAVEAEVYAMSLFLSSLTVWMALKWTFSFSKGSRARWLIALAYIIGFSIGVHQLNLLALPAIFVIMVAGVRKWKTHFLLRRFAAFLLGCIAVIVILKGIMPGAVVLAEVCDIWAVNSLRLPFWSGALAVWTLALMAVVAIAVALSYSKSGGRGRKKLNAGVLFWCLGAIMTGYSVYILIPIRAWANPPVNEGDPSSVGRFADYLERRQYGGAPLFYGRTPDSRVMRVERMSINENGDTLYDYSWNAMKVKGKDIRPMLKGGHIPDRSRFLTDEDKKWNALLAEDTLRMGYAVVGFRTEPRYTPELNMLLPRIHSGSPDDRPAYRDWTGMDTDNMVKLRISEAFDSLGNPVPIRDSSGNQTETYGLRPTYMQSLMYLAGYQIGYMYMRYLMWNFSGRQNDVPATGEIDHGNFITGIRPLDNMMLGDQSALPDEIGSDNNGHNIYWVIPFLLGMAGIIWLFTGSGSGIQTINMRSTAWFTLILFLMTGVAIVIYLNQSPGEPRERDYTFLGSYWVFSIWIGFAMLWLLKAARKWWQRILAASLVCTVPVWMFAQNLDDHDRSGRSATLDYAANLLESLDEDAILFVDGDNYVFPLWFAQEVMGIRRDVSVICYSFLGSDWYVTQLMTPRYGYDGIAMTATEGDIGLGNYNLIRFPKSNTDTLNAVEAMRELYCDMSPTPSLRHRWLEMGRDSTDRWIFDVLSIPGKSAYSLAGLRESAMLDMVATNCASRYPRPVYWHQSMGKNKYMGFYPYTEQRLFTRKLVTPDCFSDSLPLRGAEESLNVLPKLKWGGIERMAYPGPDVETQAALQRASLIRLAEEMTRLERHDMALHIARMAMVRYPSRIIPYGIRAHADSVYFEAGSLANVLRLSGEAIGDTAAVGESKRISRADSLRTVSFSRYRKTIPPERRGAISPRTNNHTVKR